MTALIIDGKQIAQKLRADWKLRADRLNGAGIAPGLAVVMVGENAASKIYVRNKIKACREVGIRSEEHLLGGDSSQETVLDLIDRLNADAGVHGILVQLPLPAQLAPAVVIERISPDKDVDGLHSRNLGSLLVRTSAIPAVHARRHHGNAEIDRAESARQGGGGGRPQQYRRQARGAAAAAGRRHRHHVPLSDPGIWPITPAAPTCSFAP